MNPVESARRFSGRLLTATAAAVVLGLIVLVGGATLLGSPAPRPTAPAVALASPTPSPTVARISRSPRPTDARPTPTPTPPTERPTPRPSPTPTATPNSASAPSSAAGFDLEGQAIDIEFPLRRETRYQYRDNFLDPRAGPPQDFNHSRVNAEGEVVRLHDGIDIYARAGEPVVAPFRGTVIDPADRWPGWQDLQEDRYGLTVAIVSSEPTSEGYVALLTHLERVWVDVGQDVGRGQILGVIGSSGNADGVEPQLHFELRAPFALDWTMLGEPRRIDAFNPFPSLVRADPKR
jgi:murein DD-endopeptidase MepM/ murein hydrolase activator NlpD